MFELQTSNAILSNSQSLHLNLYLINGRSGLFNFSPDSTQDHLRADLKPVKVDILNQTITYKVKEQVDHGRILSKSLLQLSNSSLQTQDGISSSLVSLQVEFPSSCDQTTCMLLWHPPNQTRQDWTCKFDITESTESQISNPSKKMVTIIAHDTPLDSAPTLGSISTLESKLEYIVQYDPLECLIQIQITQLVVCYSFLFSRIDGNRKGFYGGGSVHPKSKRNLLLKHAEIQGLEWSDRFWYFDLVLHWLQVGDEMEADAVVQFLVEHEVLNKSTGKMKYYRYEECG